MGPGAPAPPCLHACTLARLYACSSFGVSAVKSDGTRNICLCLTAQGILSGEPGAPAAVMVVRVSIGQVPVVLRLQADAAAEPLPSKVKR